MVISFFDQAYNMSFHQRLESIHYNACLTTTGAIRGTSKEKLYRELGLESLQLRRWYKKLGMFFKIFKSKSPQYLFKLIQKMSYYITRNADNISLFNIKCSFYKSYFFPSTIIEWNNLRNLDNFGVFKNKIFKFIRPKPNSFFNCCNLKGIRLITRLRLELSHLRKHKFKYNMQNCLNPLFSCGSSIESTYWIDLLTFWSTLNNIDWKILLESTDSYLGCVARFGTICTI